MISPAQELSDARSRAAKLQAQGFTSSEIAQRIKSEFFICIYSVRGKLWATWMEPSATRPEARPL